MGWRVWKGEGGEAGVGGEEMRGILGWVVKGQAEGREQGTGPGADICQILILSQGRMERRITISRGGLNQRSSIDLLTLG